MLYFIQTLLLHTSLTRLKYLIAKNILIKYCFSRDRFSSLSADAVEKAGSTKIDAAELLELLNSKDHVGAVTAGDGGDVSCSPVLPFSSATEF